MKNSKKTRPLFGQNLIKFRKEKGFSQKDLADLTGLSPRMILYYENEAVKPPIDKIEIIAKALNVEISKLLGTSKTTVIQEELLQIDARTLKKIKLILSLPKHKRHKVYLYAESLLKDDEEEEKKI